MIYFAQKMNSNKWLKVHTSCHEQSKKERKCENKLLHYAETKTNHDCESFNRI